MTFIFLQSQGITNIEGNSIPFPAFVMMGTLLWQTLVDSIQSPLNSVKGARSMLAKINFPREALIMAGLYNVIFNFLIRMLLLVVVMAIWQVIPGPSLVVFPIAMFGLLLTGFAIGMALVPIGSLYGDVSRAVPFVTQFWMLLTPVVYPPRSEGLAGWLSIWNPISPLIVTAREGLTNQSPSQFTEVLAVSTLAMAATLLGLFVYRLIMPHLIERMGG
jgi:lipopolysaccharide transport system permease protein